MRTTGSQAVAAGSEDDRLAAVRVAGEPLTELPADLYIPPHALRVILTAFEGPLDLLLYLIRKQNFDILDIPIEQIAAQYISYIELMQDMHIELAGEYLLMAALLAQIKSRLLLPQAAAEEDEGEDPRADLVRRLQAYEQYRQAADNLDAMSRVGRELTPVQQPPAQLAVDKAAPDADVRQLLLAFRDVMQRAELFTQHAIESEPLSVRETMTDILQCLQPGRPVAFTALCTRAAGRLGVVVCFLALLELAREALIRIQQDTSQAPLAIMLADTHDDAAPGLDHG